MPTVPRFSQKRAMPVRQASSDDDFLADVMAEAEGFAPMVYEQPQGRYAPPRGPAPDEGSQADEGGGAVDPDYPPDMLAEEKALLEMSVLSDPRAWLNDR